MTHTIEEALNQLNIGAVRFTDLTKSEQIIILEEAIKQIDVKLSKRATIKRTAQKAVSNAALIVTGTAILKQKEAFTAVNLTKGITAAILFAVSSELTTHGDLGLYKIELESKLIEIKTSAALSSLSSLA